MTARKMDRGVFYASVRSTIFKTGLTQDQVDGTNRLLDEFERRFPDPSTDELQFGGYILGTAYHETAHTMLPIAEYGKGRGRAYGKPAGPYGQIYYGRGDVQLTWYDNYKRMGELLDIPELVKNPDLALVPEISAMIIFEGMLRGESGRGDFTGKSLEDYFEGPGETRKDWEEARRIVNGVDRKVLIAGYGIDFYMALVKAYEAAKDVEEAIQPPATGPDEDPIPEVETPDDDTILIDRPEGMSPDLWGKFVEALVAFVASFFKGAKA